LAGCKICEWVGCVTGAKPALVCHPLYIIVMRKGYKQGDLTDYLVSSLCSSWQCSSEILGRLYTAPGLWHLYTIHVYDQNTALTCNCFTKVSN